MLLIVNNPNVPSINISMGILRTKDKATVTEDFCFNLGFSV